MKANLCIYLLKYFEKISYKQTIPIQALNTRITCSLITKGLIQKTAVRKFSQDNKATPFLVKEIRKLCDKAEQWKIGGQHTCLKHCLNEILHMMTMIKDTNMKTVPVFFRDYVDPASSSLLLFTTATPPDTHASRQPDNRN